MIKTQLNEIKTKEERPNDQYPEFLEAIKNNFNSIVKNNVPLFTTNAEGLFDTFLNYLPEEARQHYTCRACRNFVNRYGGLVTISENGKMESVLWGKVPEFFTLSVEEMKKIVLKSKVNGIFLSEDKILGQPTTGEWHHISVTLPSTMIYRERLKNANQMMAEKQEDFRILISGLLEYSIEVVEKAVALLQTESLYRSNKVLGVAEWFLQLHNQRSNAKNSNIRDNITWLAVAKAPAGFCHIKSSMIGTLLEDIKDGLSSDSISYRFAEKMNPSTHMRAQVAPSQGNIQQAEKIVEKMGIKNSLKRRYSRLEEIPYFIWQNKVNKTIDKSNKNVGVFSNITPKEKITSPDKFSLPTTTMTWDKFQKTVLPTTDSIEVKVDNPNRLMALVTASDENSPNIMQWGNSFSWYYHGGIDGEIKRRVESAGGRYENNEIRCSLIWEGLTDLDLHCHTPKGEHIYFGNKRSGNGWLDVDANGIDGSTESPVENMRWITNAPQGHYKFYVHNYSEKVNKNGTSFKIELEINGKIYHYYGKPLINRDNVVVFEFDYLKGQEPIINSKTYSSNDNWNIPMNDFVKVNCITSSPNLWGDNPIVHSGSHIFFLLDECKDLSEGKGRGFFTEMLKSDLREIRKTLEAYTANTPIEETDKASACGVGYSKDNEWNLILKINSNNSTRIIKIDRWD